MWETCNRQGFAAKKILTFVFGSVTNVCIFVLSSKIIISQQKNKQL